MAESTLTRNGLFTGRLAHCEETLSFGHAGDGFFPAADLLRPGVLESHVDRFGMEYPGGDARAVFSLWSQWYFGTVLVPVTALALGRRRVLPLQPRQVGIRLDHRKHHPAAIQLLDDGRSAPEADDLALLEPLVHEHLTPIVHHISRSSGLPPRTLWGNAATYIDWTIRQLDPRLGDADLHPLFCRPQWRDGEPNPFRGTLRAVDEDDAPSLRRKVCCLRYLLPDVADCGDVCPVARICTA